MKHNNPDPVLNRTFVTLPTNKRDPLIRKKKKKRKQKTKTKVTQFVCCEIVES